MISSSRSDRRRLFELDHDAGPAADELASLSDVVGPLHEREGDPIRPLFEGEGEIGAVLFGHRRQRQHRIRHVDALAVGKRAADAAQRLGEALPQVSVSSRTLPSSSSNSVPGRSASKISGCGRGARLFVAGPPIEVEAERLRRRELDRPRSKGTEPQLGSLQVSQDADRPPGRAFDLPDCLEPGAMVVMRAMTEIEAEDVDPGLE